ncbi:3'-5' exonuclease [Microbacterium hatanonis]|uniref:DNA 3'-5' helicase n=1 Tax=Microbacterium hatanonis TaxID=404366 RepID=A0A5C8I2V8_9MICO|nr:3'-5' exonuclease [Microbacterium hatanonis]TXK12364.1 AAA family ATPase [Microbacterium hatanonis]
MPEVTLSKTDDHKLDKSVQAKVLTFLMKLREDDSAYGLRIKKLEQQKDPRARTGRVDDSWRALLFCLDHAGERTYVYAGTYEHDEAIERARTRVLRTNPVTHVAEIIDATAPALSPKIVVDYSGPGKPISFLGDHGYPVADLVGGLGFEKVDAQRLYSATSENDLAAMADNFENEWQRLAILGMAVGDTIAKIRADLGLEDADSVTAHGGAEIGPDDLLGDAELLGALMSPASRMQFTLVSDDEELRRILEEGDFGAWRVFLHPEQVKYVERDFNGPFRLTGGAGTGKTVVLLHRARRLALADSGARVVLTTFTKALAGMLRRDLARLDDGIPQTSLLGEPGVYVTGIDALAATVRDRAGNDFWSVAGEAVFGAAITERTSMVSNSQGWDAAASVLADAPADTTSPAFLEAEYVQVILPQRVRTLSGYLAARRPGRGVALDRARRAAVWTAVEAYRAGAAKARRLTWAELSAMASAYLESRAGEAPADHLLIDEGQDLSPLHWQLVRALAPAATNDVFIAEDVHQRIYGHRIVLSRYGIKVVGRSRRLTLNYRTTQENLVYALRMLEDAHYIDAAEETQSSHGYRSVRRGPAPRLFGGNHVWEQTDAVAHAIADWQAAGVGDSIAILGRTTVALKRLQRQLDDRGIATALYEEAITPGTPLLVTMHSAKGLEFSRVVLFDVSEGSVPLPLALHGLSGADLEDAMLRERSLLYVAASRARDELIVTWAGGPSELL